MKAGDRQVALVEETSDVPFHRFDFNPEVLEFDEISLEGYRLGATSSVVVNEYEDFALEGGTTLQVRVVEHDQPRLIAVRQTFSVQGRKEGWVFRAMLACHRGEGELVIKFSTGTLDEKATFTIPFDLNKPGGRTAAGYQQVSVPCPLTGDEVSVELSIQYVRLIDDGVEDVPYFFVADAEMVHAEAGWLKLLPHQIKGGDHVSGPWYRARVPVFRSEDEWPVTIVLDRDEVPLFSPEFNSVSLVEDWGHAIVVKAQKADRFVLFIDGQPIEQISIGVENTSVLIPAKYLRGEIITISVRDLSGSQEFLSIPVLAPRILTPADVMARESRAPYPTDMTVRSNHRYQSLRAHFENPLPCLDAASLASAIQTLDCTYETVKLHKIAFPEVKSPKVSIIIPAHNKVEVTYYGLCALLVAHNKASFEVIVVDDASSDETSKIEEIVSGIRVVRNEEPQRFIRACNAGVAQARGEYVVLLNNDTEPTGGWLDALLDAFNKLDNVGLAGSKLLYPDGKLQDAGGIVWGNGNPWNYGNRANPWDPRFSYARQADYLSGAAMMTTRKIWDEVGGLSSYLEPMYFEDTDFAFKVREAGYKTWFVPSSIVYHFEGMTSGTDTSSGFKRFQEVNRPKFKRRWVREYSGFGKAGEKPDLEKDRGIVGRVLFIDYATPREDRDAGSYAARREIELVQSLGYKVTFLPQNLAHLGSYTEELQNSGVEVITAPFYRSLVDFLRERAAEFDAVYITRYYVAQDTLRLIREFAPNAKVLFNNADLHFLRELRAALSEDDGTRLALVSSVRNQELEMMKAADVVLSYNEVEHAVISSHTDGQVRVMSCPWVVDIPKKIPSAEGRKGLSFLGSFRHHPNAEGVHWFCKSVMPLLEGSGAHLSIYGSGMNDEIKMLESDAVNPVGYIENVADAFNRHRVFVAPLLSGAGIKGKVLSAVAHGIPTVLTPIAAEGIGLRSGHDCIIVEEPRDWADAITSLMKDDEMWSAMSSAARAYAGSRFSFEAGREKMRAAFEAVDLFGSV
ncbi:glycosyltransferase [Maritalea mobilis]|uniref:glycosyltransferase n=1 Tax=Maritalea mobilis TaxID=483324 RepID=UPI001C95BF6C|nr:glycosyltransferase [Maritalea mobilis]MBY6199738.1 glycosyltransferase [Maritalea mobilis]